MPARPIWRGHPCLSPLSPVLLPLWNARHDRTAIRFNMINVRRPAIGSGRSPPTPRPGKELESPQPMVKGYEFRKANQYLLLADEDLGQHQGWRVPR